MRDEGSKRDGCLTHFGEPRVALGIPGSIWEIKLPAPLATPPVRIPQEEGLKKAKGGRLRCVTAAAYYRGLANCRYRFELYLRYLSST